MVPRARRAVAALATLVFLAAYVVVAVTVEGLLPNTPWVRLAYNLVVGVAWGVPLLPLFRWMGKED